MSRWGEEPARMGEILGGVGRALGLDGAIGTGRVWARWPEIVGDAIAAHAEPTSIKDGVLRIRTDSPAWATELGYRGAEIARRANEVAGAGIVTEVRVWTGPGAIEGRGRDGRAPSAAPDRASPESPAETPANEPLEALGRARAAWARRRAGGRTPDSGEASPRGPAKPPKNHKDAGGW